MPMLSHIWNTNGSHALPVPQQQAPADTGQPGAVRLDPPNRRAIIVGSDLSLSHALTTVCSAWEAMEERGQMSEQTLDKFGLLLGRFDRYTALRGAVLLNDTGPALVEDFVTAKGRSRHGHPAESATATQRLRLSVIRAAYRTMRELGLTDQDPTRDIILPARTPGTVRPLDEAEVISLRHAAEFVSRPSRHAAAAALALSGGHTAEIGHTRVRDLDPLHNRVWMQGSSKADPRWCPLDSWAMRILTARARYVAARRLRPAAASSAPLAVSDRHASDASLQARVCVALGDLIKRIGLGADPDVKPASVTAWAAADTFEQTGRIEDAARHLGLRSLDRAATTIGFTWRNIDRRPQQEESRA